jgi:hypothetical protein
MAQEPTRPGRENGSTIGYGRDRPEALGDNEHAWARNRRDDFRPSRGLWVRPGRLPDREGERVSRSALHIRVEGSLDPCAVDALLEGVGGADEVVFDFLRAPRCSDATLGYFVDRLSSVSATLRMTGLSRHQEHLLGYLGASIQRPAENGPLERDSGECDRLIRRGT